MHYIWGYGYVMFSDTTVFFSCVLISPLCRVQFVFVYRVVFRFMHDSFSKTNCQPNNARRLLWEIFSRVYVGLVVTSRRNIFPCRIQESKKKINKRVSRPWSSVAITISGGGGWHFIVILNWERNVRFENDSEWSLRCFGSSIYYNRDCFVVHFCFL